MVFIRLASISMRSVWSSGSQPGYIYISTSLYSRHLDMTNICSEKTLFGRQQLSSTNDLSNFSKEVSVIFHIGHGMVFNFLKGGFMISKKSIPCFCKWLEHLDR